VASNALLDEEFGTNDQEQIIKAILGNGALQEKVVCIFLTSIPHCHANLKDQRLMMPFSQDAERQGSRNDSVGARGGH
jgi:hypothetical protein